MNKLKKESAQKETDEKNVDKTTIYEIEFITIYTVATPTTGQPSYRAKFQMH
jgi:hypothetical protein